MSKMLRLNIVDDRWMINNYGANVERSWRDKTAVFGEMPGPVPSKLWDTKKYLVQNKKFLSYLRPYWFENVAESGQNKRPSRSGSSM